MSKYISQDWYRKSIPEFEDLTLTEFRKLKIKPNIALLAATDIEIESILKELDSIPESSSRYKVNVKSATYYIGQFGEFVAVAICTDMGTTGPDAVTVSTMNLIRTWNPSAILSVGIAMGYDRNIHNAGDVLISKNIATYEVAKQDKGKTISRAMLPSASRILVNRFKNTWDWKFQRPDGSECKKHIGLILAGDKLINDLEFKNELWETFPKAIGAEMEAAGLWAAAESHNKPWITIKAVCDWGDGDKNDDFQLLAAASAVSLCKKVFSSHTALEGIMRINYESKLSRINSMKLFFHRNYINNISYEKLNHLTKISRTKISTFEDININGEGFVSDIFPHCSNGEISKLERALNCPRGYLNAGNEDDFYSYYLSYYFNKKKNDKFLINNYSRIKSIVFDFDGTLTTPDFKISSWQRIWKYLGYSLNDCAEYALQYMNNEITHQEWCDITCVKFREKGLKESDLGVLAGQIKLVPNTIETIKKIKKMGIQTYVTSGSIIELIELVLGKDINLFDDIKANKFDFDENHVIEKISGTLYDFEGKAKFIQELIEKNKLNPHEVLFVGNSDNDNWAYKSGCRTLCVNPNNIDFSNAWAWHNLIMDFDNLAMLMPYISRK